MAAIQSIERALAEYMAACYGDSPIPEDQVRQVRQAFLSGVYWRDTEVCLPGDCEPALRKLLGVEKDRN